MVLAGVFTGVRQGDSGAVHRLPVALFGPQEHVTLRHVKLRVRVMASDEVKRTEPYQLSLIAPRTVKCRRCGRGAWGHGWLGISPAPVV